MPRIFKVSQSDYRVKVQQGGNIILDTGLNVGNVIVTGDLVVRGETTTVDTTNLTIEDNIVLLNKGETGVGITEKQAGIEIDRGSLPNAQFLFDELVSHFDPSVGSSIPGTFVFKLADGTISGIQLSSITIDPNYDFIFDMQNSNSALYLGSSPNYSSLVTDDNHIPNKKYINDYVAAGLVVPGMADVDRIYFAISGIEQTRAQALSTYIEFAVGGTQRAKITNNGLDVDNINLFGNTITNKTVNNLVLTSNNNVVKIDAILNLEDQNSFQSPITGSTKIYSRSDLIAIEDTPGKTGIFFANDVSSDELVAKNRALLFSMIF